MNIEIFLSMKEKYEIMNQHLYEIVHLYQDMIDLLNSQLEKSPNDKNTIYELELMMHGKKSYLDKIKQIDVFINLCNKKAEQKLSNQAKEILLRCDHDFIDDYIDVDLERSQKITYCKKCGVTT